MDAKQEQLRDLQLRIYSAYFDVCDLEGKLGGLHQQMRLLDLIQDPEIRQETSTKIFHAMMFLQKEDLARARERFSRHLATLLEVAGFVKTEEKNV